MLTHPKEKKPRKGLTDNQRWVYGFMLLFFALFLLVSVVSYYFHWADDQDAVLWGSIWSRRGVDVMNHGGKLGAVLANYVVGQWFGVFGIAIPAVLIILALRIMRYRPAFLNRSVRTAVVIMILGSLSLGLLFGTGWDLFGTGPGGAHGVYVSEWLASFMGAAGTGLLLLCSWVLLAVYMNRNTIKLVNRFGRKLADNGMKVGGAVTDMVRRTPEVRAEAAQEDAGTEPDGELPEEEESIVDGGGTAETLHGEDDIREALAFEFPPSGDTDRVVSVDGDFTVISPEDEPAEPRPDALSDLPWDTIQADIPVRPVRGTDGEAASSPGSLEVIDLTGDLPEERVRDRVHEASAGEGEMEIVVAEAVEVILEDGDIENRLFDPTLELSKYQKPPVEILEDHKVEVVVTEEEIYENKNQILRTLENFGIRIDKIKATIGPTVTLYEIVPAPGVRISKIKNLEDDIALSLSALGIRIIAPIPGKGTIGIEVPNKDKKVVSMYSVIKSQKFQESGAELPVVLGKNIQNETFVIDLAKMPHLLVAGATGQGKSVGLNAILTSLLYRKHPAELKFVLVDPKKVELTLYKRLENHFLAKMPDQDEAIITDTHKVVYTLNSLCVEMDARYDLLRKAEVRHIKEYNEKFTHRRLNPDNGHRFLPYIVVVIDEFADMIMTAGREIETPIARLAQLARAIGIHLVIATQRPTTNIITGMIKANFPARIAFRVTSMIDSRTIIDQPGANQLVGRGDMLVSTGSDLVRVQCAFVDTPEIERIVEFIGNQRGYPAAYELPEYTPEDGGTATKNVDMASIDPMFEDVARFIVQNQQGSTSSIQRRFSIGYNRAGRIMDQIEVAGIVGKAEGSKPREVLISDMQSLEMLLSNMDSLR